MLLHEISAVSPDGNFQMYWNPMSHVNGIADFIQYIMASSSSSSSLVSCPALLFKLQR